MNKARGSVQRMLATALAVAGVGLALSGCVATQDWVKTYVRDQNASIESKLRQSDSRLSQLDARVSQVDGRVSDVATQTADARRVADEDAAKANAVDNRVTQAIASHEQLLLVESTPLQFRTGAHALRPEHRKALDRVKQVLSQNPTYTAQIIGEADKPGSEDYNLKLSLLRAQEVQKYLAEGSEGAMLHRIDVLGVGEDLAPSRKADREHRQITVAIYKPIVE